MLRATTYMILLAIQIVFVGFLLGQDDQEDESSGKWDFVNIKIFSPELFIDFEMAPIKALVGSKMHFGKQNNQDLGLNELLESTRYIYSASLQRFLFVSDDPESFRKRVNKLKNSNKYNNIFVSMNVEGEGRVVLGASQRMEIGLLSFEENISKISRILRRTTSVSTEKIASGASFPIKDRFARITSNKDKLLISDIAFYSKEMTEDIVNSIEDSGEKNLELLRKHLVGDYLAVDYQNWKLRRKKMSKRQKMVGIESNSSEKILANTQIYGVVLLNSGDVGEIECMTYENTEDAKAVFVEMKKSNHDSKIVRDNNAILDYKIIKISEIVDIVKSRKRKNIQKENEVKKIRSRIGDN